MPKNPSLSKTSGNRILKAIKISEAVIPMCILWSEECIFHLMSLLTQTKCMCILYADEASYETGGLLNKGKCHIGRLETELEYFSNTEDSGH